jgi:WD40 repeat protein
VRRIELSSLPLAMSTTHNSTFLTVLQQDNVLKMIDMVNSENTSEIMTTHEQAASMKICPNGRYVLTGGSKGDICIWRVQKRELK